VSIDNLVDKLIKENNKYLKYKENFKEGDLEIYKDIYINKDINIIFEKLIDDILNNGLVDEDSIFYFPEKHNISEDEFCDLCRALDEFADHEFYIRYSEYQRHFQVQYTTNKTLDNVLEFEYVSGQGGSWSCRFAKNPGEKLLQIYINKEEIKRWEDII